MDNTTVDRFAMMTYAHVETDHRLTSAHYFYFDKEKTEKVVDMSAGTSKSTLLLHAANLLYFWPY